MIEQRRSLPIHSVREAGVYLRVTPCSACGGGPLVADPREVAQDADGHRLSVAAACNACNHRRQFVFDTNQVQRSGSKPIDLGELGGPADAQAGATPSPVNPSDEPSRVIDVAGWLTLYSMIVETARSPAGEASTPTQRTSRRRALLEAGQCLDEALKFFEPGNDLPPEEAFFGADSRRRFRERPELFTRQRLIELRGPLPR